MIHLNVDIDSDYSSSSDEESSSRFDFELPDCRIPDFLDTQRKWRGYVMATHTLSLWCDLQLKIESYSPISLSEEEVNTVIRTMAEDIVYVHGMRSFFPEDHCKECGILH